MAEQCDLGGVEVWARHGARLKEHWSAAHTDERSERRLANGFERAGGLLGTSSRAPVRPLRRHPRVVVEEAVDRATQCSSLAAAKAQCWTYGVPGGFASRRPRSWSIGGHDRGSDHGTRVIRFCGPGYTVPRNSTYLANASRSISPTCRFVPCVNVLFELANSSF